MKYFYIFAFTFLFLVTDVFSAQSEFRIIAYLSVNHWNISQLDFSKVNYVNLSFANPDATGNLIFSQNITDVVNQAHAKNAKVFISIGGGNMSSNASTYYATGFLPANRDAFIQKMINYVQTNNLDGVDVDLENDALLIPYYNDFVVSLATKLHTAGKQISSAVAQWSGDRINKTTLDAFDWINLMSYDVTAPWRPETPGQHAPMNKVTGDYAYWNTTRMVNKLKITVGVPFYGYEFVNSTTVNTWTYNDIVTTYPGAENTDVVNGNLYYNGIPTITQKTLYAYQNGGGIMYWEWGQDATGIKSLSNAIYNKVNSLNTGIETSVITVKLYNNQISKKIGIALPINDTCSVDVYSISSVKVYSSLFQSNLEINTAKWQKGVYFVRLNMKNTLQTIKIILQ